MDLFSTDILLTDIFLTCANNGTYFRPVYKVDLFLTAEKKISLKISRKSKPKSQISKIATNFLSKLAQIV